MATILEYIDNVNAYGTSESVKKSWLSRIREGATKEKLSNLSDKVKQRMAEALQQEDRDDAGRTTEYV